MTPSRKVYIVVLDGAGDRPNVQLDGQTPLLYARTPHLDALAARSRMARVHVIGPGFWPESDSGAMAILSYDPLTHYTGRGPLEGLGAGMIASDGSAVAFRANFGSYDADRQRLDRRTARGLSDSELQQLAGELRDQLSLQDLGPFEFSITAFARHRAIIGIRSNGPRLDGRVTNTDPGFRNVGVFGVPVDYHEGRPLESRAIDPQNAGARRAAQLVNSVAERASEILSLSSVNRSRAERGVMPANVLLIRDGGIAPQPLPSFASLHGRSLHLFGQIFAEKGLASLVDGSFDFSVQREDEVPSAYLSRAVAAFLAADEDVVFIHLKGPDEPGHDNLPFDKVRAIEDIDASFIGPLCAEADDEATIIVCCDHATPCGLGIHSDDPVPVMVVRPDWRPDGIGRFSEQDSARGSVPVERMCDLLAEALSERHAL